MLSATAEAADWPEAEPEATGFRTDPGDSLDAAVDAGELEYLHGVVVIKDGQLVTERYYPGRDWRWGRDLGVVDFDADSIHDLRSVTKSIVGLLYGIALDEGLVPPPDAVLVEQFPAYEDLIADPKRRRMLVWHALAMKLGTEWNEELPYSDPRNSEIAMEMAPDRYRFVLDRPFVKKPGSWWDYNGGATALIAHLIERGSGQSLKDFARERLFEPMGIEEIDWIQGSDGVYSAASGLRLRPRDLAKIGQLVLHGGRWEGRQLVPEAWLEESFTPRTTLFSGIKYGYHWWLGETRAGAPWMAGFGNGGQRLFILPSAKLIVAVTAGRYNHPEAYKIPVAVIVEHVLPALAAH
ncbi:MAG: serine hydrolase [Kiloniellales bacterium]